MQSKYIHYSNLSSRLDPLYYLSDLAIFTDRQITACIGELCSSMYSGFAAGKETQVKKESGYIQIRPTNIMPDGRLSFEKNVYVPKNRNYTFIPQKAVLFNNTNSQELVGKTAILDLPNEDQYYCSNHITVIIPDQTKLIPEYLWIILNLYQRRTIFYSICTNWNNQSGVNVNLLKSIRIPIFSKETNVSLDYQRKIVAVWLEAFSVERTKEQEAKDLLDSIDDYLLSELGIERPERTENGRFFYTSHKEVTGKRLDPVAYSKQTQNIKQAIVNGKYSCSTLKSLITHEAAGDWGVDVIDNYDSQTYSKCLVLRSTEFNLHHNIVIDNTKAKYRLISNKKLDYIDLQPNDLIIEKSGGSENQPVGRVAIITKDLFERDRLCYSNFVQKIRLDKNQVIPTYACFFLRLVHNMKLTETMQSQTNGIRNLIMSEYYAQQIPLPPLEKQKEIITHIGTLCNRAKQLQQEATDIMTNAKQQIEQMILGE